ERQGARLGRRRSRRAAERLREAVAEIEVGFEVLAARDEEAALAQVGLDQLERTFRRAQLEHRYPSERAAARRNSTPSPRSSTCVRSSAEWMSREASSTSIVRNGKKPYATVPKASRSQCESVKPAQQRGASFAPGSVSPTQSEIAVQRGVSRAERVP